MKIKYIPIEDLRPYENNPRINSDAVSYVANSIEKFGFKQPIVVDRDNVIVAGHVRQKAAQKLGLDMAPCVIADDLTPEQIKAYRLADNKSTEYSQWDFDLLDIELDGIVDIDMSDFGFISTNDISKGYKDETPGTLKSRFIMPPFSVLDARQGDWQKRKKEWLKIIDSGKGRSEGLIGEGMKGLALKAKANLTGTSIFDPVLCEILLNWYSPKSGKIIDPFAGGSVRGIVSSFLQREYWGNDLREEQIQANLDNYRQLQNSTDFYGGQLMQPNWTIGDSRDIDRLIPEDDFDMLLTCPPYGDLEVYSNDENDISNMDYENFLLAYREILTRSIAKLKENAFIAVVVGEVRDKAGYYRNFIGDTIQAIESAGAKYYNEIIFITMGGTLALRAGRQFEATRKVANTHQKALIFLNSKGDDSALQEYMTEFEQRKILTPMKKSILIFLRGNSKLAKNDLSDYSYDIF